MAKTDNPITEDLPLYIRWSPDRSPHAIELRLELVSKIAEQIRLSRQSGIEMGGFLIGTKPQSPVPTFRIDDVEMISAGLDDSTVFLPEPSRWEAVRASSIGRKGEAKIIGFFRTHLRMGPMRPSLADRTMLTRDLGSDSSVVLLVGAQIPNMAAFFVSESGQLPDEPAVREFVFNEKEFRELPEMPPEAHEPLPAIEERPESGRLGLYARIAALVLIAVGACALMWSFARQPSMPRWFGGDTHLHLIITPEKRLLRISWDRGARELNQATGATLVIHEGNARSQIQLGMDDLRLGSVEYQSAGGRVQAQLTVDSPEGPLGSETARWPRNPGT